MKFITAHVAPGSNADIIMVRHLKFRIITVHEFRLQSRCK